MKRLLLILLFMFFMPLAANADIKVWVDDNNVGHIQCDMFGLEAALEIKDQVKYVEEVMEGKRYKRKNPGPIVFHPPTAEELLRARQQAVIQQQVADREADRQAVIQQQIADRQAVENFNKKLDRIRRSVDSWGAINAFR